MKGARTPKTKGVWYRKKKTIKLTAPADRIEDLDALPFPDFSDFDVEAYWQGIPLMFARGCSYRCVFCVNRRYLSREISRSGGSVYEEIRTHVRNRGVRKFVFADDSLLSPRNLDEFMKFCDAVTRDGLEIKWRVYGQRIIPGLTKEKVRRMREAGLDVIRLGVESFSGRIRKDMGKVADDEMTDRTIELFLDQGVKTHLWLIYGYPIETDDDFRLMSERIEKQGRRFQDICLNCFIPNDEYRLNRPGVVEFEEGEPPTSHKWRSEHVDLEKRKERFLRLVELLNGLGIEFTISEPHYRRYYRTWNEDLRAELEREWSEP